jgi:uncharacterized membrane protein YfcA
MLVPPGALQPKTVRPSLPAPLSNPRRTSFFALIFRPEDPPKNLPLAEIFKKAAANLVQVLLNSFIISIFSQKSRRKNDPKSTFFAPFRLFSALFGSFFTPLLAPRFARFAALFCFASRHLFAHRPARGPKARVAPSAPPICASPGAPKLRQFAPVLPLHNRVSRGSAPNFVASSLFFIRLQRAQVCR